MFSFDYLWRVPELGPGADLLMDLLQELVAVYVRLVLDEEPHGAGAVVADAVFEGPVGELEPPEREVDDRAVVAVVLHVWGLRGVRAFAR